jgi:hypothetical protein
MSPSLKKLLIPDLILDLLGITGDSCFRRNEVKKAGMR